MDLTGRCALVTGASRGIGRCIALELASRGANIAVNYVAMEDRNISDAEEVVAACSDIGVQALAVEADVCKYEACQAMVGAVVGEFGKLDILVNNAGIVRDRSFRKMSPEEWQAVLDVNLSGVFNASKAALEPLLESGRGRIVSMSSVIGVTGGFGQTNYSATKAGIIGFTKSLAREVARKGVTVNAVAPGFIATEMLGDIPEDVMTKYLEQIPVGRLGKPEEIAKLIGFLSSDDAAYITGTVININGGFYM